MALLGSLAAGCSADAVRFTDSELFTGATQNQREIIGDPAGQPFPGDVRASSGAGGYDTTASRDAVRPVDLTSGAVSRSALAPAAPADSGGYATGSSALAPAGGAPADSSLRTASVAAMPRDAAVPHPNDVGGDGWSGTGGTQVTLRPGETIYNLSRRFGVPVKEILRANAISDETSVQAGTKIVIPTYVYSQKAPISAPDSHPRVAKASSSFGEARTERKPEPAPEPKREAVLPNTPKARDGHEVRSAGEAGKLTRQGNPAGATYTVASGDTLYEIARRHGTTTPALKEANGLSSGLIRVGQVLAIPGAGKSSEPADRTASMATGDNGAGTATAAAAKAQSEPLPQYTPPARKADDVIIEAKAEAPDATGVGKMRWPARGRIISEFGKTYSGRRNDGIDIALPSGTPIKAAENGVVIYAGDSLKDFGNTVLLRHENGLVTVYGHANELKVARGDIVKRGDEIAVSGMTGATETPKLHFEIRDNSVPVDPMGYLQ